MYKFSYQKESIFRKLFLSLDLFIMILWNSLAIMILWNSLVIIEASFAKAYFLLIGTCLLKIGRTVFLNYSRSVVFKFIFQISDQNFSLSTFSWSLWFIIFSCSFWKLILNPVTISKLKRVLFQKPYCVENNLVHLLR